MIFKAPGNTINKWSAYYKQPQLFITIPGDDIIMYSYYHWWTWGCFHNPPRWVIREHMPSCPSPNLDNLDSRFRRISKLEFLVRTGQSLESTMEGLL